MPYTYTLTINNRSAHSDYFMVFQNDPGSFDSNAMALAWFSKYSNPGPNVTVKFTWTIDWGFSWADTGVLAPGVRYDANDVTPATSTTNQITLDYNGAFQFTNQQAGPDPTLFYIRENGDIPVNSSGSVGITMSGSTVYATQARPNNNLTFSPHPQYFLAYGNYQEGQVIDVSTVNNPLELDYETGIYSLTVTLNADDTWSPTLSLAEVNTRFLEMRKKNPKLALTDMV